MNTKTFRRQVPTGPASWLEKERVRISLKAGHDSNRIRKALKGCGVELSRGTERVPGDLGDMLECFRHIKLSLDSLASRRRRPAKKVALAILEQIRNDLYIHLDEHFRGLKRPLDEIIEELDHQIVGGGKGRQERTFSGKSRRKRQTFSSILAWSAKGR